MNEEDRFPSDPDETVEVGISFGWRHNGRRAVSTALAPAYYAVYVYRVTIHEAANQLQIQIQALGEWDLPNPSSCLVCWRRRDESWEDLAAAERQDKDKPTRFFRPVWTPKQESAGYFSGSLVLPLMSVVNCRSLLWSREDDTPISSQNQNQPKIICLDLEFACGGGPWRAADYPRKTILEVDVSSKTLDVKCPRTKPPVRPADAWKPVLPASVEERFRIRERSKQEQAGT